MELILNRVHELDCLKLLSKIPDNKVDMGVSDVPYGLSIMNKSWDKAIPSQEVFNEMLRVLKPGAFCFVFSHARQDLLYRMIQRLDNAGFMIDLPSIYWTYATGIGLGANCGKAIDKRLGEEGEIIKRYGVSGIDKSRVESGYRPTIKKPGVKREPVSDMAKEFSEAYIRYRPKSALEIILVAMKPVETKTYIEQVMKNGKACTWLDRVRVPLIGIENHGTAANKKETCRYFGDMAGEYSTIKQGETHERYRDAGRYPTNLLSQDNRLDTGELHKSGTTEAHHVSHVPKTKENGAYGKFKENPIVPRQGDSGSFNRFFCFDSWARENLPKTYPFLPVAKPAASTKQGRDAHLTEKPPQIFAYLITLASRPGDIILDPYVGSGSSALAAVALNRDFIAGDNDPAHVKIAETRLKRLTVQREERELG